jgi:hypothetical protein
MVEVVVDVPKGTLDGSPMCLSHCTSSYLCVVSSVLMGDMQFHIACMDYQFMPQAEANAWKAGG